MLNKTISFFMFICASASSLSINAENSTACINEHMKYNLSVCAVFNNEAYHLKDWIDYHSHLGVEHFYLYNAGSKDHYSFVLIPYINQGLVTLVNWPCQEKTADIDSHTWALSTQIPAYENAVNFVAREETKWLVILDVNEFLVCSKGNLNDLLIDYDDYPGISLVSKTYDGSILVQSSKMHTIHSTETDNRQENVDEQVAKIIFKPDLCAGFMWPPYQCRLNSDLPSVQADSKELNVKHYINRKKTSLYSRKNAPHSHDNTFLGKSRIPGTQSSHLGYDEGHKMLPIYNAIPGFLQRLQNKMNANREL